MQKIIRQNPNINWLLDEIDTYYVHVSGADAYDKLNSGLLKPTFDKSFKSLYDLFAQHADFKLPSNYVDKKIKPLDLPKYDENNVIICFSGGKDSVALTLKCLEKGYNVYLYTLKHINVAFSDEIKFARELAEKLNLPLFEDDIKWSGHHDWMEHPMKNMIIANGALSYGIRENIGTRIFFGNYTTGTTEDVDFARCGGDCMDMWASYNEIIDRIIPGFKVEADLLNMGETLDIVTSRKDLLDYTLSCLCRHSLRPSRAQWVKDTFGIELPKNRCGSCYKCCVEYIYMADHDLIQFSPRYYKYCMDRLYKVHLDELGLAYSIYSVWDSYMFYDIKESKLYDELVNARMFIRSIKWKDEKIVKKWSQ